MMSRFGQQPWIQQVMDGVKHAVQNGIENLSGSSVSHNAHPEDGYRFAARTREQLMQSEELVAGNGNVRAGRKVLDPASQDLGAPRWEDEEEPPRRLIVPGEAEEAPSPKAQQEEGWIL